LDTWLIYYLGAKDSDYVRAVGKRWLISLIARLYEPGCKADHVLMLEGPQGKRKSTALSLLVSDDYFTDHVSDLGSKDCMLEMAGKWLIELSEIENYLHDVRSRNRFKAFITSQIDYFREPYQRRPVAHLRHCILAATTNSTKTLTDPTGTRRIWPVECGEIKIDELKRIVDPLLAEARDCYRNGDKWYLETEELEALAAAEQEERYEPGHWDDAIMEWLENPRQRRETGCPVEPWDGTEKGKATIQDILIHGIGKTLDRIEQRDRNSVARCLEHEKWKVHQVRSRSEQRGKRFYYSPQRFEEKDW
jgi:predicted P-loop ATPase